MYALCKEKLQEAYPACRSILDPDTWDRIAAACTMAAGPETFPNTLALQMDNLGSHNSFLPELARLEWSCHKVTSGEIDIPPEVERLEVNPTLELLQLCWKNLPSICTSQEHVASATPKPGEELVLVWRDPRTNRTRVRAATDEDLLVLKMVVEGTEPKEAATVGRVPVRAVLAAIDRAVHGGILLAPRSSIRRDPAIFAAGQDTVDRFLTSPTFAIQWHITQACDLHCKHCYDRSNRSPLRLDQAFRILDDLHTFCRNRNVRGHVSFTGGNPLLYPHFPELYRGASERGLAMAILGNPAPRKRIEELVAIERPVFFQVSLEGLPEHNDMIRGPGHFKRVIEFLGVLRELQVFSMVMLTLTRDNIDQVLALAEMLRDLVDDFTFNRLSMVGEGANLHLPTRDEYVAFLKAYAESSKSNPIMSLKDNLFNILRHQMGIEPFGGCTGYGCGAAFNFIAILSDGEAHACRKFPSPIGSVFEQNIADLYDSEVAERYRSGCHACGSCAIRPVCGGCLAIAYSHGLNVFEERDPYCFL